MANMPAPIIQTPTQPSNANITGGTIGGVPVTTLATEDFLSIGAWPTIVANAATISPGPYGPGKYVVPSTLALGANATVSLDKTGSPVTNMEIVIVCRALALGFTLTIANAAAGGNGGNLIVIPASLTKPILVLIVFNGVDWIGPNLGGPILEVVA